MFRFIIKIYLLIVNQFIVLGHYFCIFYIYDIVHL